MSLGKGTILCSPPWIPYQKWVWSKQLRKKIKKRKILSGVASTISSYWSGICLESIWVVLWAWHWKAMKMKTGLLHSPPSRPGKVSESKSSQAANFRVVTFRHHACRWCGTPRLLQEEHKNIGTTVLAQTKDPSSAASYFQQGPLVHPSRHLGKSNNRWSTCGAPPELLPRFWLFLPQSIFWISCHLSVTLSAFFFQVVG